MENVGVVLVFPMCGITFYILYDIVNVILLIFRQNLQIEVGHFALFSLFENNYLYWIFQIITKKYPDIQEKELNTSAL